MKLSDDLRRKLQRYSRVDKRILECHIKASPEGRLVEYLRERANYHRMEYRFATAELLLEFADWYEGALNE